LKNGRTKVVSARSAPQMNKIRPRSRPMAPV
jgi:hypothetical protein